MTLWATIVAATALFGWLTVLLLPWQPWRNRERIRCSHSGSSGVADITAVIPARNEAEHIARVVSRLLETKAVTRVVVVDDQSQDATASVARQAGAEVLTGQPRPADWSGKLWAVHQGLAHVRSRYVLLLDADILIDRATLMALGDKLVSDDLALVSIMARLRTRTFWEKLLMPAFVYFFKMLYPFALANARRSRVAAAAGGCMLLRREALAAVDDMGLIRGALIDDCALAAALKQRGFGTWLGLGAGVVSVRGYDSLWDIGEMVSRNAFTQLRYSTVLLLGCTVALLVFFMAPVALMFVPAPLAASLAVGSLVALMISYQPTLRYYGLNPLWSALLPVAAALYLWMTWLSAVRCWRGVRSRWRGRTYGTSVGT